MGCTSSRSHRPTLATATSPALRRAAALQAACAVAARYGLRAADARVLLDCNNTVVHLAPLPLVAKVCDVTARPAGPAALALEVDVALHLGRCGAPIVLPSPELPAGPHRRGDHLVTFWRYQSHDPELAIDARAVARALIECHRALDTYRGHAKSFLERQVARAGRLLGEPGTLGGLLPADRSFLSDQLGRIVAELRDRRPALRLLHGDPHRGNVLVGRRGCLLIDFDLGDSAGGRGHRHPGAGRRRGAGRRLRRVRLRAGLL
jgi:Phosphotransferase enzyme family